MMPTTDDLIQRLLSLSALDARIRDLNERLEKAPAAVAEREAAAKALEEKAAQVRAKLLQLRAQRRLRDAEVRGLDAKLTKLKAQSGSVRSNKEFVAFRSELANAQAESDRLQGEILKMIEVEEQADARIRQLDEQRDAERARAEALRAATLAQLGDVRAERDALARERADHVAGLPKDALQTYERCLQARGSGMAHLEGEYCGGCGALATRNDVYAVQNRSRLVPCKACNRILYL